MMTASPKKRPLSKGSSADAAADPQSRASSSARPPLPKKLRVDSDPKDGDPQCSRRGIPVACNLQDFKVPDRHSPPSRGVDKDGHFEYELGDNIGSRFKILSLLGEGTFGRVFECWDRKYKDCVAIKIIRNVRKYREAAMIELEVLNTLAANDPGDTSHCIHLRIWFEYRGHVCMVFPKLGSSIYDFLRRNGYRPFPLDVIMHFAQQILHSVAFMHRLTIIHTDLKPENVLLCENKYVKVEHTRGCRLGRRIPTSTDLKVIDLGSATFDDEYHSSIVSTRHYRAPEVILGLGWSYPCDVWSIGCIIVELITGKALFQTHENLEHLAMMERVIGPVPRRMVVHASREASRYFSSRHTLLWPAKSTERRSIRNVNRLEPLKRMLRQEGDATIQPHLDVLHDLLCHMLRFDPKRRWGAHTCLQHQFFRKNIRSLLPPDYQEQACSSKGYKKDASERRTAHSQGHHERRRGTRSERRGTAEGAEGGVRAESSGGTATARRSPSLSDKLPSRRKSTAAKALSPVSDSDRGDAEEEPRPKMPRRQGSGVDMVLSSGHASVKPLPLWVGGADMMPETNRRQAAVS